jgi:ribosome-binding factor A
VTGVELTRDLKQAKVFVTELSSNSADMSDHKELITALNNASGYLKRLLSQRLDLRAIPKLQFRYDNTIERGLKLSLLIDEARKKDKD